jgi:hypothetical protein
MPDRFGFHKVSGDAPFRELIAEWWGVGVGNARLHRERRNCRGRTRSHVLGQHGGRDWQWFSRLSNETLGGRRVLRRHPRSMAPGHYWRGHEGASNGRLRDRHTASWVSVGLALQAKEPSDFVDPGLRPGLMWSGLTGHRRCRRCITLTADSFFTFNLPRGNTKVAPSSLPP